MKKLFTLSIILMLFTLSFTGCSVDNGAEEITDDTVLGIVNDITSSYTQMKDFEVPYGTFHEIASQHFSETLMTQFNEMLIFASEGAEYSGTDLLALSDEDYQALKTTKQAYVSELFGEITYEPLSFSPVYSDPELDWKYVYVAAQMTSSQMEPISIYYKYTFRYNEDLSKWEIIGMTSKAFTDQGDPSLTEYTTHNGEAIEFTN